MNRIPAKVSASALAVILIVGSWYLAVGALGFDPTQRTYSAVVDLRDAAGLRPGSDVVYRGANIGRVDELVDRDGFVRMSFSYDAAHRIPVDSRMRWRTSRPWASPSSPCFRTRTVARGSRTEPT